MTTGRFKRILAAALGLMAAVGAWTTLDRLGDLVEAVGTGADPASGYTAVSSIIDADEVTWGPDSPGLIRQLDGGARTAVAESYLSALAILDGSELMSGVDPAAFLTGPAARAVAGGRPLAPVDRTHVLSVRFHSADGQIVEVDDRARSLYHADNDVWVTDESAIALLVLLDGSWHLRHRVISDTSTDRFAPAGSQVDSAGAFVDAVTDAVSLGDRSGLLEIVMPAALTALALIASAAVIFKETRQEPRKETNR